MSAVVVSLTKSFFYQISSKFYEWIASIKLLLKFEYKFSRTNDNQDGRQNGRRLSICFCGQSTLIIYYPKILYQTLGFSDNQKGRQKIPRWPPKWPPPISLHLWTL